MSSPELFLLFWFFLVVFFWVGFCFPCGPLPCPRLAQYPSCPHPNSSCLFGLYRRNTIGRALVKPVHTQSPLQADHSSLHRLQQRQRGDEGEGQIGRETDP